MSVAEETGSIPKPGRRWRRRLKRAAITFVVLVALLVGGLTYAFKVSGLEINTPNGVNVIMARKPIPGPPPEAAQAVLSSLRSLQEGSPQDFGGSTYDHDEERVVVNVATARGEELVAGLPVPDTVEVFVRTDAMSVADRRRITEVAFEEIDQIWGAGYDVLNDRVYLESSSISPGLLGRVKELFGTDDVVVMWEPFSEPPRLL
ncbi:MAG TPA: hypothetical protein VFK52_13190 [Nocardioidaceae bacterium]|nr:hypothetical protein [Nocardioidaceae bacterium]